MRALVFKISIITTIICLTYSCGSDVDVSPSQRESIVYYLNQEDFEHINVNGVYKRIVNGDRYGRDELTDSKIGDSIVFNFEAYEFNSSPSEDWYDTNKRYLAEATEGLNPEYMDLTPRKVKIGSGGLIKGLQIGLPDCRVGDSIHLYITSDLAYGEHKIPGIKANSAILYILNIVDLK